MFCLFTRTADCSAAHMTLALRAFQGCRNVVVPACIAQVCPIPTAAQYPTLLPSWIEWDLYMTLFWKFLLFYSKRANESQDMAPRRVTTHLARVSPPASASGSIDPVPCCLQTNELSRFERPESNLFPCSVIFHSEKEIS